MASRSVPAYERQTSSDENMEVNGIHNGHGQNGTVVMQNGEHRSERPRSSGANVTSPQLNGSDHFDTANQNGNGYPRIVPHEAERARKARPAALLRAKSDFGPRHRDEPSSPPPDDKLAHIRHGWDDEYNSNEYLSLLHSVSSYSNCTPTLLTLF